MHTLASEFQDERRQSPNKLSTDERIIPNAEAY